MFNPKPLPPITLRLDSNAALLKGSFNVFNSMIAEQTFSKFVESLSKVFGISNVDTNITDDVVEFYGDSVKDIFDTSGAMDKQYHLNLSSGAQAQSSTVNLPASLKGKNLQDVLANKDYSSLSIEDGIALLQAIKEAVEGIDQSSSKIQDVLKNNDISWFNDFGIYNCALFGFLMEAVQDMPKKVKGIFTQGNDFYKWAMKKLDDYEKDCKKNKKDPSFDVKAFKDEWKGFAAKMDNLQKIDVKGVRSLANRPMITTGFSLNMINNTRSDQYKREKDQWKQEKEKKAEEVREEKRIEQKHVQKARAEKAKATQAKASAKARKKSRKA